MRVSRGPSPDFTMRLSVDIETPSSAATSANDKYRFIGFSEFMTFSNTKSRPADAERLIQIESRTRPRRW
jgi:hypothetical protein